MSHGSTNIVRFNIACDAIYELLYKYKMNVYGYISFRLLLQFG